MKIIGLHSIPSKSVRFVRKVLCGERLINSREPEGFAASLDVPGEVRPTTVDPGTWWAYQDCQWARMSLGWRQGRRSSRGAARLRWAGAGGQRAWMGYPDAAATMIRSKSGV
jgi:hypothetical protein